MLSRLVRAPRSGAMRILDWINDNPLTTAGVTMGIVAGGYLLLLVQVEVGNAERTANLATLLWSVGTDRPAYLLAVLVGIGSVFYRE